MRTIYAFAAAVGVQSQRPPKQELTTDAWKQWTSDNGWSSVDTERRYKQFKEMFLHFYTNEQLTKTYGYGCYCLNLGDRPLSGTMTGVVPVDDKDMHCFQFTRCNRCVTFDFGPECTPEQIIYNFDIDMDTNDVTCLDPKDTCQRAICECDKYTVVEFASVIDFYDPLNHAFNGFEMEDECIKRERPPSIGPVQTDCCGEYPNRRPYNKNSVKNFNCCDGEVTSSNTCEQSSFN